MENCSEKPQTKIYQKIIEPVWDFPCIKQVIGRVIRYGSHANLPVNQLKTAIISKITKATSGI